MSAAPQEILNLDTTLEDEIVSLSHWSGDQLAPTDHSRSEANLRAWRSYLPENCVEMMVKMGWDTST